MKHLLNILSLLVFLSVSAHGETYFRLAWDTTSPNRDLNSKQEVVNSERLFSTGWYYVTDTSTKFKMQLVKTNEYFFVDPKPITSSQEIIQMAIYGRREGGYGLVMKLNEKGTNEWSIATYKWINKRLGFILDNKLLEVDHVNSEITGGTTALIQGRFTKEELEGFKKIIESEQLSR